MQNLLTNRKPERLPLIDAEIWFWHQIVLGRLHDALLHELIEATDWQHEPITVYGRCCLQPRLSAWYGDACYRYSGIHLQPLPWTVVLLDLKTRIEALTEQHYNSVLLNYYRDQNDSMGMHSDDERELGQQPAIASLSLGEERTLRFKHKSRKDIGTVKLPLPTGSLLLMQGDTQQHWQHGINKERCPCKARINLTFRNVKILEG